MEEEHRNILRKYRGAITSDLEPLKVLNRLTVLGDEDRDEIKAEKTRKDQAYALIDMLPRKGSNAFQDFVYALYELKGQDHLAKLLLKDSGIEIPNISKDDVGMTSQHKKILCRNADKLHHINLDKLVKQLLLSGLLDEEDKQNLLNHAKPAYDRMQMLLTDILPRRGPTAFHALLQGLEKVDPSMAHMLQQDAGMTGSSNGALYPTIPPVQETAPYSLDTTVHDILEEKPELFTKFREAMDKDDFWDNGWKRFYKELGLPPGRETTFEGSEGGPTGNVLKGWISKEGRKATVQALLVAVNRSERKDCAMILEKSLGCQLDCVDSPIENITRKMDSLSTAPREVKYFGDLNESQATVIAKKLGSNAEKQLRKVLLERGLSDSNLSTKELVLWSKMTSFRDYTNSLDDSDREQAIKALRDALPRPKGVLGPLLPPNKFIRDVGYTCRRNLTRHLSADDHWKVLAERLGLDHVTIKFLDSPRISNPADEVLRHWEVKANSTVETLYDILVEIGCPFIADLL